MSELRFGVIGAGRTGRLHAEILSRDLEGTRVVSVADTNLSAARNLIAALGLAASAQYPDEVWQRGDLDAVCITAGTPAHADLVEAAVRAGLHAFCEKPLCVTMAEADRIRSALARSNVRFQLGFMRRFDAECRRAKWVIEQGKIGAVMMIRSLVRGAGLPPRWACDPSVSNGLLAEMNSHDFDTVRWLAGTEVRRVFAAARALKARDLASEIPGFYDNAAVLLELESGGLATVEGSALVEYGYDSRVEVLGERGVMFVGALADGAPTVYSAPRNGGHGDSRFPYRTWAERFQEAFRAQLTHFIQCVRDDAIPEVGFEDGVRALAIALAAKQSIVSGIPVAL